MTDWTAAIGTGTILLRDTGSSAQFHITAGNGTAFDYGLKWSGNVGGAGVSGTFRYEPGMGWRMVAEYGVTTSMTVSFTKDENSGSSGLGGPATVSGYFGRSTTPPPPNPIGLDQIELTSMRYRFNSAGDGGSGILEWQIQYGVEGSGTALYMSSGGTSTLTNLLPGKRYIVYSRGRNANGWGGWSAASAASLRSGSRVKMSDGTWKWSVVWVKVLGIWKASQPWVKVAGVWIKTY